MHASLPSQGKREWRDCEGHLQRLLLALTWEWRLIRKAPWVPAQPSSSKCADLGAEEGEGREGKERPGARAGHSVWSWGTKAETRCWPGPRHGGQGSWERAQQAKPSNVFSCSSKLLLHRPSAWGGLVPWRKQTGPHSIMIHIPYTKNQDMKCPKRVRCTTDSSRPSARNWVPLSPTEWLTTH